jgi:hypothetical protein
MYQDGQESRTIKVTSEPPDKFGIGGRRSYTNRGNPTALTISRNYQRSRWKEFL